MRRFHAGSAFLCLALIGLSSCGSDSNDPSTVAGRLVYHEHWGSASRLVRVGWDGSNRQVLWEAEPPDYVASPPYPSPDGRIVIFQTANGWLQVPAGGGSATAFLPPSIDGGYAIDPAWSSDGQSIAWRVNRSDDPYSSHVGIAPPGSTSAQLVTPDSLYVLEFGWSPDATQLVLCAATGTGTESMTLGLYTIARNGANVRRLTTLISECNQAWSPDGSVIAFANDNILTILPTGADEHPVLAEPWYRTSYQLFWSPDGKSLLTNTNRALSLVDVQRGTYQDFANIGVGTANPWSPDGRRILYLEYSGRSTPENPVIWLELKVSLPGGSSSIQLSPDSVDVGSPAWLVSADPD